MKYVLLVLAGVFLSLFLFTDSFAHSGRTNSAGCHNDYVHGGYHCHNGGYSAPYTPWSCTIDDLKFYTSSFAESYWNSKIDSSVKDTYTKLLERNALQGDLDYWHTKFPYNNCKGAGWNSQTIWNEVLNSDERKALSAKKIQLASVPVKTQPVKEETDYTWLWIIGGLCFYGGIGLYGFYSDKKVK